MQPNTFLSPQDPYTQIVSKFATQLPAIKTKLSDDDWTEFHNQLKEILLLLNNAEDDTERNTAIERLRRLSHFPQDYYLVSEIHAGVFKGTSFEKSSHQVSNNPAASWKRPAFSAEVF